MRPLLLVVTIALALMHPMSAQAPAAQTRPDPKTIKFVGDRFKPLTWDEMTPAQRTMVEHLVAGPRAGANGPFNVLLRSPEMGDIAQQFGASMRFSQATRRNANETGMRCTAPKASGWSSWYAHGRAARQTGAKTAIVRR